MADNAVVVRNESSHTETHVVIHHLGLGPLLQFDNDNIVVPIFIGANDNEIDTLGSLWNVILYGDLYLVVDITVIHNIPHELHGIVPGFELAVLSGMQPSLPDETENLVSDDASSHILDELSFIGIVDNHVANSSLNFLALPGKTDYTNISIFSNPLQHEPFNSGMLIFIAEKFGEIIANALPL